MGKITTDMVNGEPLPKRGDLVQTNVGSRRERTWFVLRVKATKPIKGVPRGLVWIERWWEIEPALRIRLWNSAERGGGQNVIHFRRYPQKKKKKFEQLMGA